VQERGLFYQKKFTKVENITTSKKLELSLVKQGRNKTWLSKELGISRPVLYQRLKDNFWTINEITILKSHGLI